MAQFYSGLSFLIAFLTVDVSLRLLRSNPGERTYRSFFVLGALIGSYGVFYGVIAVTRNPRAVETIYRISSLSWTVVPAAIFVFANHFIGRMRNRRFSRWVYVVYVPSAFFAAAGVAGRLLAQEFLPLPAGWKESGFYQSVFDSLFILYLSTITVVALVQMVLMYRTLKVEKKRRLTRLVTAFTLAAFLITAVTNLIMNTFEGYRIPPLGHFFQGLFVIGIGAFMLQARVLKFTPQLLADDVFRMMTDIVVVADNDNQVIQISGAGLEFWGIRESRLGKGRKQGVYLDDLLGGSGVIPNSGGSAEGIIELTDGKGRTVPYRFTSKSIVDYFGGTQGLFFIANNAEELVELERRTGKLEDLNSKLKAMSETDSLTGLNNRRKAEFALNREIAKAARYGHSFSVIMFDLDDFKRINDAKGHAVGDEVLVEIARRTRTEIREIDFPCRWGGEEFLILCPESNLQGAAVIAERLREAIDGLLVGNAGKITASFGVAEFKPGEDGEALIRRADKRLYEAKEAGKNAVKA